MNITVIAALALFVSVCSLGISFWSAFRDRVRLKITAAIYGGGNTEYGPVHMEIRVTNVGRRIAVLTMSGGQLADGGWQGVHLEGGSGKHLAESEFYQYDFFAHDIEAVSPDGESTYTSLWIEDSHGRRHEVPNSARLLKELARRGEIDSKAGT